VNPFDWKREFPHGGFDVVLGNPPYVQAALIIDHKEYFKNKYSTFSGNSDLYVFFVEQSFKVLGENGIYGMIISNKWLKADYGLSLRKYLANNVDIYQILDFGELPVFEGVGTFPCIIIGAHHTDQRIETKFVPIKELPPKRAIESQIVDLGFQISLRDSNANNWVLVPKDQKSVLSTISKDNILLKDYPGITTRRGVVTGYNPAFIIDDETKRRLIHYDISAADLIKPFVSGDETRRYSLSWQGRYLIFTRRGIDISKYPSILNHLSPWRKELEPRRKNTKDTIGRKPGIYKWYEIQDSTSYYEEFDKPKIVYGQFQIAPHFCFSPSSMYFGSNHYMIVHNNTRFLYYLLGILNSKLYFFYMKSIAGVLGDADEGGRLISQKSHIFKFPIHDCDLLDPIDKARHDKMVKLVESMLSLHKHRAAAKTQADQELYQRQICMSYTDYHRMKLQR
ncbi:MAG: Eco57I restriction-modification methylase domain-containing protein, partial [Bacteroidia bacterium]|nr:Eco57I restriction-modification methylase domain-containing protein [Bacteroidia bacterium]